MNDQVPTRQYERLLGGHARASSAHIDVSALNGLSKEGLSTLNGAAGSHHVELAQ